MIRYFRRFFRALLNGIRKPVPVKTPFHISCRENGYNAVVTDDTTGKIVLDGLSEGEQTFLEPGIYIIHETDIVQA